MREIKRRLGGRNVFAPNSTWSFEVVVTLDRGRFQARIDERRAELATTSLPSETEIPGGARDCDLMMKWIAITVARLIDPNAPPPQPPRPPSPPKIKLPDPLLPQEKRTELSPTPPPSPPPSPVLAMTVVARGGVRYGLVPNVAPEVSVFAGVGKGRWEASLGLSWTLALTTTTTLKNGTAEYAFGMNIAWLGGCFHAIRFAKSVLSTCAYVGGGASTSIAPAWNARPPPWTGASLQPRLRLIPHPNLTIELGADLTAPITRHNVWLCTSETDLTQCASSQLVKVFEQTAISAAGFLGVGMSIP
jgi:hypothetical protein